MTNRVEPVPMEAGFQLRGAAVTRTETFVDAAFAFALTLLVISFDKLPNSFEEFQAALRSIPTFAACFAQIALFWYAHHNWSRRYGLDDLPTALLSLALVFVTLVYVFPLRIVFSGLFAWITGGWTPYALGSHNAAELGWIFVVYGVGFVAMSGLVILLYGHGYRCRERLQLNAAEIFVTKTEMRSWGILLTVGLVSTLVAIWASDQWKPFAGMVYASLAIIMPAFGVWSERRYRRVLDTL